MRREFEEMKERSRKTLQMLCERKFERAFEDDTVDRYAAAHGVSYDEAWDAIARECFRPLGESDQRMREAEEHTAAVQLARALGQDPPPSPEQQRTDLEEQERAAFGFSHSDVEQRARERGIPYLEAMSALENEHALTLRERRSREEQVRLQQFYEDFDRVVELEEEGA